MPALWQPSGHGQVPAAAVLGGNDQNHEPLYVGRAIQESDCIPGKVVPSHGVCYVAHGGREHGHRQYQVLVNPYGSELAWVQGTSGYIPPGAIQGGQQGDGQKLYIGRAHYQGSLVIGKVHPGHRTLYVSFGGNEVPISSYEVLVAKDISH